MKLSKLISGIVLGAALVLTGTSMYGDVKVKASTSENLLLSYNFDQSSGTTVTDSSGNGYHGTLSSGATWNTDGKNGSCINLSGSNSYVTIPNGVLNGVHNVTITADVYLNTSNENTWIFGLGPDSGKYIFVNSKNSKGYPYGAITTNGTVGNGYKNEKGVTNLKQLPTGTWTSIALVISMDTHSARLYINGRLTQSNNDITEDPASIYDATKAFSGYIGRSLYTADGYLNGKIDNFRIYGSALSTSQIGEKSLLLDYNFNQTSGVTVTDNSGFGYHGTLQGGATFVSGYANLSNNGYVSIPNGVMKGVNNVTILCDVYLNSNNTNTWVYGIGPDSGKYIFLNTKNSAGKTYAAITSTGTVGNGYQGEQGVRDVTSLSTGQWVKLALVISGDTGMEKLYINGDLVSSMSGITTLPSAMFSSTASVTGYIGKSLYSDDPYLSGRIDNFRIYGSELNPKEIMEHASVNLKTLRNGELWLDTEGEPIDAAGGCIIKVGSTYYWYGNSGVYVNCYSSTDLVNWTFQNAIVGPGTKDTSGQEAADLAIPCVVERPKVIYNSTTGKYVLWFHYDSPNYGLGKVAVATSSTPTGDFTYQGSFNPGGLDARDMTIYQDTDGSAYLIASTVVNGRLSLFKLSNDYLTCTFMYNIYGGETVGGYYAGREAPAVVKENGVYYLITSSCAGWYPNQAQYSTCSTNLASSTAASWSGMKPVGNSSAFYSQSTWALTLNGTSGTSYMLMSDRNRIPGTGDQNFYFVWFPLKITNGVPSFEFSDTIALNTTAGTITNVNKGSNVALAKSSVASTSNSANPASYANDGNYLTEWVASGVTYPSTWTVDLGASYKLNSVQLSWFLHNGSEAVQYYRILTSTDGVTYKEIRNNNNNTTYGFNVDYMGGLSARYVRIQMDRSVPWNGPTNNWYTPRIFEVKILGE